MCHIKCACINVHLRISVSMHINIDWNVHVVCESIHYNYYVCIYVYAWVHDGNDDLSGTFWTLNYVIIMCVYMCVCVCVCVCNSCTYHVLATDQSYHHGAIMKS